MSKFLRPAVGVLCLGVLAVGILALDPTGLPPSSVRGDADKRLSIAEEVALREELNEQQEAIQQREEAKRHLAAEVIGRRCSLVEAIAQFQDLDRQWPPRTWLPNQTPKDFGMSQDEWDGREVIRFVQVVLADRPDAAAAVADRLERELQQLLADRNKHRPVPAEPREEQSR